MTDYKTISNNIRAQRELYDEKKLTWKAFEKKALALITPLKTGYAGNSPSKAMQAFLKKHLKQTNAVQLSLFMRNTLPLLTEKINTLTIWRGNIRKIFREILHPGDKNARLDNEIAANIDSTAFSENDFEERKQLQEASKQRKLTNVQTITPDNVIDAFNTLNSKPVRTIAESVIMLMLATGRRSIGVLKEADFQEDTQNATRIIVTKQSKQKEGKDRRGREIKSRGEFSTYFLFFKNYSELRKVWDDTRKQIKDAGISDLENKEITNLYNQKLGRVVKRIFPMLRKDLQTAHRMRDIYIGYASRLYKPKTMDDSVFETKYLGHKLGSNTRENYRGIQIGEPSVQTTTQLKKAQDKLDNKVADLSRQINEIVVPRIDQGNMDMDYAEIMKHAKGLAKKGKVTYRGLKKAAGVGTRKINHFMKYYWDSAENKPRYSERKQEAKQPPTEIKRVTRSKARETKETKSESKRFVPAPNKDEEEEEEIMLPPPKPKTPKEKKAIPPRRSARLANKR